MKVATEDGVPTVYLHIAGSAIAFETSGEVLETVEFDEEGEPDWSSAGICDHRGAGGHEGHVYLREALTAAEGNAALAGFNIERVPPPA